MCEPFQLKHNGFSLPWPTQRGIPFDYNQMWFVMYDKIFPFGFLGCIAIKHDRSTYVTYKQEVHVQYVELLCVPLYQHGCRRNYRSYLKWEILCSLGL